MCFLACSIIGWFSHIQPQWNSARGRGKRTVRVLAPGGARCQFDTYILHICAFVELPSVFFFALRRGAVRNPGSSSHVKKLGLNKTTQKSVTPKQMMNVPLKSLLLLLNSPYAQDKRVWLNPYSIHSQHGEILTFC